jgi:MoaA/NifB/PqqE/SkfB family radical SAM enzyme
LEASGWPILQPSQLDIFQINVGKLCNMTCRHCHVDSGPDRTEENMDRATIDACIRAIEISGAHTVDLTGGAPELNPHFEYLVDECVKRGKHVIDRCNLTILTTRRYRHGYNQREEKRERGDNNKLTAINLSGLVSLEDLFPGLVLLPE